MTDILRDRLGLSAQARSDLGSASKKVKSIATFLSDAVESIKKNKSVVEAIKDNVPWWAPSVGTAVAESIPVIKFVATLLSDIAKEHDPDVLGFLACTLSYQRSVEEAMDWAEIPDGAQHATDEIKPKLAALEPSNNISFSKFSFRKALDHTFIRQADAAFDYYLENAGYSDQERRNLLNRVHRRFVGNLKTILSHGKTKEKFEPFTQRMELESEQERAYDDILSHINHQRWLFEEAPVFRKEPFALADIYINSECGNLEWGKIRAGTDANRGGTIIRQDSIDPFSESDDCGGRHDLLKTVLELIGDSSFTEAIVIQGIAGSGKSSFTLKLCSELDKQGLYPIRVRLRDLSLDRHIAEALPRALFPPDRELAPTSHSRTSDDPFLENRIFDEKTTFRNATICPYVLILDGWDEISISATEGFKIRVDRMLEQIRAEYLRRPGAPVRVILTGRPSTAVSESPFLRDTTPILTIRPIRPDQLRKFVSNLDLALKQRPAEVKGSKPDLWNLPPLQELEPVFRRYESDFTGAKYRASGVQIETQGEFAMLGLPLLAHLAVRLIAQWKGDLLELFASPTTLYRSIVDLTVGKGGNIDEIAIEPLSRVTGAPLRRLLQGTAAAMTAHGSESISYRELSLRLKLPDEQLDQSASQLTDRYDLMSLMISFFFKGGQKHLGCEFVHKSFREYLFAEAIVEALKDFNLKDSDEAEKRMPYWKEFSKGSPEYELSRRLSELLSPQWLSSEVASHLEHLLAWEIERSSSDMIPHAGATKPILMNQWTHVRDALAEMWLWWAEGVHMRPQPVRDEMTQAITFEQPYAHKLIEADAPRDRSAAGTRIAPARVTTMDAHLGDGLFRLCAIVHYQIAVRNGWLATREPNPELSRPSQLWKGVSDVRQGPKQCQSKIVQPQNSWTMFAPAGDDPRYFLNYVSRINAAGWRPTGNFPADVEASGIDLREVYLAIPAGPRVRGKSCCWKHANLSRAVGFMGWFESDDFSEVCAESADFHFSYLSEAQLGGADLTGADLSGADLGYAHLSEVNLSRTNLQGTNLVKANLKGANLRRNILTGANLGDANLNRADLGRAVLSGVNLQGANLSDADLSGANLNGASLQSANLSGANLSEAQLEAVDLIGMNLRDMNMNRAVLARARLTGANLCRAKLSGADLTGAILSGADVSEADLSEANISGATLIGTNLNNADLRGANLDSTRLSGANLSGAKRH